MMLLVAILICLFIGIILLFPGCYATPKAIADEDFDSYYNHDMGAHEVYQQKDPKISVAESELQAKYRWDAKDKKGENVYDKYYETEVLQKNSGYEPTYGDVASGIEYDVKFNNGAEPGKGYNLKDMQDNLLFANFYHPHMGGSDQKVTVQLSQKIL